MAKSFQFLEIYNVMLSYEVVRHGYIYFFWLPKFFFSLTYFNPANVSVFFSPTLFLQILGNAILFYQSVYIANLLGKTRQRSGEFALLYEYL